MNARYSIKLLNIQGVTPGISSTQRWKFPFLSDYVQSSLVKPCIVALTETWLDPCHSDAQVYLKNFNFFRADRNNRERGGVLLYIREDIIIASHDVHDDGFCQGLFCISHTSKLMICCAYKPQNYSPKSFCNLIDFFNDCISKIDFPYSYTIMVLGDFNFPDLWNPESEQLLPKTLDEEKLVKFMDDHFLVQYVDIPTRENNILDLFITNNDRLVSNIKSEPTILSDHDIVDILLSPGEFQIEPLPVLGEHKNHGKVDFKSLNLFKADFQAISNELRMVDWENLWQNSNLEEFPHLLYDTVLRCCQKFTPIKESNQSKNVLYKDKSYRSLLRKLKKTKTRMKCVELKNPSSPKIDHMKLEIDEIKEKIKLLSFQVLNTEEQKAINKIKSKPRYFFRYAKKFSKVKRSISQLFSKDGSIKTGSKQIADTLQEQFVSTFSDPLNPDKKVPPNTNTSPGQSLAGFKLSLDDIVSAIDEININSSGPDFSIPAPVLKNCKNDLAVPLLAMWTESLKCGLVPSFYKKQVIAPVFKKGSRANAENYRPISLTAHEVKVFERVLRNRIVDYLEANSLLSCKQHGFRKGKSCLTQLLNHYDKILSSLLRNDGTDTIFLDFSKAFDKVDHQILLQKVKNLGICGSVYAWIEDFLKNREQMVAIGGAYSFLAAVVSGVPQGTVLGPILFLIYVNDIDCVKHSSIGCFADDTRISKQISCTSDSALLQEDLDRVVEWAKDNNMKLHPDKFVFVNFNCRSTRSLLLSHLPFYNETICYLSSDKVLETSNSVKDLGVTFTPELNWTTHVCTIVKSAKKKAGWALSCFRDRSPCTMLTLYKSLIRSLLEYNCPLWNGLSLHEVRDLEAVQRSFTSKIKCPPHVQNYWDRLQFLHLMSLQRRRERYMVIFMWKIAYKKVSNDLNVTFYQNSRMGICAKVPKIMAAQSKAQSLYDMSFAVKGPQLWNIILKDIKSIDKLEHFKIKLDKFLNSFPDKPPIAGYAIQNYNSLLEWRSAGVRVS